MQIDDEATFCLFWGAVACYLAYVLLSGKASDDGPKKYSLSRMSDFRRKRGIPHWPVIQATVTQATRSIYSNLMDFHRAIPDKIDVAFEFQRAGIRYENRFVVLYPPRKTIGHAWQRTSPSVSVGFPSRVRHALTRSGAETARRHVDEPRQPRRSKPLEFGSKRGG